jgi:ketosteroid isomerase-like protein
LTVECIQEIVAAFNSRDVERIASYFAEDATFFPSRGAAVEGARVHGREAIKKYIGDRFKIIPDMRWDDLWEFRGDKILNKDTYWKLRSE